MFFKRFRLAFFAALMLSFASMDAPEAEAGHYGRQYYGGWSYHPTTTYHYCRYYYQPVVTVPSYNYHYVIYYPSRPTYRYYYNPIRRLFWGRFEMDANGNAVGYSMLAEKDRQSSLEDIPESAFPQPTSMPPIPESDDGTSMDLPPLEVTSIK
jgi:hypothetical protein